MWTAARYAATDARAVSGVNAATIVSAVLAAALTRVFITGSDLVAAGLGMAVLGATFLAFFAYYFARNLSGWNRRLAPNYLRLAADQVMFAIRPRNWDSWIGIPREGTACEVRDPTGHVACAEFLSHTSNPTWAFTYPHDFGLPVGAVPAGTYRAIWRQRTKRGRWLELFRYDAEISEEVAQPWRTGAAGVS